MPTYPWRQAYDEPPFVREFAPRSQPIYPYTSQESLSLEAVDKEYAAVVIENDLLRLTFLPELNGRLYSAFDKVNRAEILYANPSVKPALFGLRGAWWAAGVEYNFPNSHSTTTLDPVDWLVRKHPDGSASFICGDVEWVSRMSWSVEVRLRPGRAAIEMTSRLYNGGDFPRRFYYWVNAAVPVHEQTQFVYPPSTHRLYTHPPMDASRIAYVDYPVHKGADISWFGNIPQHFPIFAERMIEDFFGLYHHHLDTGLVHVADHALVPGRKVWTFGTARDGRIWIDLLTDSKVDYAELQVGPFPLQSDYRMLAPGRSIVQEDVWFPVCGLGGFNAASEALAAHVAVQRSGVTVRLCASRELNDATVACTRSGAPAAEQRVSLAPLAPQTLTFPLSPGESPDGLRLVCRDADGDTVLTYVHESRTTTHDASAPAGGSAADADGACGRGRYAEEQGYPRDARRHYSEAASTNPDAGAALARLQAASGQYEAACEQADQVLRRDRENADALYVRALCLLHSGRLDAAEAALSVLARAERRLALRLLARVSVMRGRYAEGMDRVKHSTAAYGPDPYLLGLEALCLRKLGRRNLASACLDRAVALFPFEPLVRGEQLLLDRSDPLGPSSGQQAIEIACRHLALGQSEDALAVLSRQCDSRADHLLPLVACYRGCVEDKLGRRECAATWFEKALDSTQGWDFAFRPESEPVLTRLLARFPHADVARYQLGNLLASLDRWDEAAQHWGDVHGRWRPAARRNLGVYWWRVKGDREQAASFYAGVASGAECGSMTLWEYDHLLEEQGRSAERLAVLRRHDRLVRSDPRLLLRLASAYAAAGQAQESLHVLASSRFPLCEGKMLPRLIYEDVCRALGADGRQGNGWAQSLAFLTKPLDYPENLGAGKPAGNMEAEWCYRAGRLLQEHGQDEQARSWFRRGAEPDTVLDVGFFPLRDLVWEHPGDVVDVYAWRNRAFRARCCLALGRTDAGNEILDDIRAFVADKAQAGRADEAEVRRIRELLDDGEARDARTSPKPKRNASPETGESKR